MELDQFFFEGKFHTRQIDKRFVKDNAQECKAWLIDIKTARRMGLTKKVALDCFGASSADDLRRQIIDIASS